MHAAVNCLEKGFPTVLYSRTHLRIPCESHSVNVDQYCFRLESHIGLEIYNVPPEIRVPKVRNRWYRRSCFLQLRSFKIQDFFSLDRGSKRKLGRLEICSEILERTFIQIDAVYSCIYYTTLGFVLVTETWMVPGNWIENWMLWRKPKVSVSEAKNTERPYHGRSKLKFSYGRDEHLRPL